MGEQGRSGAASYRVRTPVLQGISDRGRFSADTGPADTLSAIPFPDTLLSCPKGHGSAAFARRHLLQNRTHPPGGCRGVAAVIGAVRIASSGVRPAEPGD